MILIDPPRWPHRGTIWSHLVSDVSHDELHDFAARLEIPRRAFQGDHYDIPQEWYARAVELGAVPTDSRQLLRRIVAAGLRRRAAPPP